MRKKLIGVLLFCFVISCADIDLQIETINFNGISLQFCDSPTADAANLLFKINGTESLILELQSGALNNGVVGDTVTTESTVPGQSSITYRIFDDAVTTNYFCDDVPPASPIVVEEVTAQDGQVIIETLANADSTNFVHTISLSGISFITESGERITNLAIDEFGEVTTTVPN